MSRPTSDFYHVQSFRSPVRPLLSEAKPSYVYSILRPHGQSSKKSSLTAAERGEAELHILNSKTTWSEFQKPSQTAGEQGEAKLHILYYKTTYSEF